MAFSERSFKVVKCMNNEPSTSKYGEFAPVGGCDATIEIDAKSVRGLCSDCTQRVVNLNYTRSWRDEE